MRHAGRSLLLSLRKTCPRARPDIVLSAKTKPKSASRQSQERGPALQFLSQVPSGCTLPGLLAVARNRAFFQPRHLQTRLRTRRKPQEATGSDFARCLVPERRAHTLQLGPELLRVLLCISVNTDKLSLQACVGMRLPQIHEAS